MSLLVSSSLSRRYSNYFWSCHPPTAQGIEQFYTHQWHPAWCWLSWPLRRLTPGLRREGNGSSLEPSPRFRFVVNHSLGPLTVRISAKILPVTRQGEGLRLCTRRLETGLSQLGVKWGSRGSCENSGSWCCPSMTLDLRLKANTPHLIIWLPLCNYVCGISRYDIWPGQARPRSIGARKHKMGRQISPSTDPSRAQILFWFRPVPLLHQLSSHDL